jgi:hypothetical protein
MLKMYWFLKQKSALAHSGGPFDYWIGGDFGLLLADFWVPFGLFGVSEGGFGSLWSDFGITLTSLCVYEGRF